MFDDILFDEQGQGPCRNPIVKVIPLSAYPGWIAQLRADGMWCATNGPALTIGSPEFMEIIAEVRKMEFDARQYAMDQQKSC